jgi:hypothetical protein
VFPPAHLTSLDRPSNFLLSSLASGDLFLLLADARLVVVFTPAEFRDDAGLLAGLLEALDRAFEGLIVLKFNQSHLDHFCLSIYS